MFCALLLSTAVLVLSAGCSLPLRLQITLKNNVMELKTRIENREAVPAMKVRLTGDYRSANYGMAWEELMDFCRKHNLPENCESEYVSIYLDDPQTTPAEKCRLDVCIATPILEGKSSEGDVRIEKLDGGKFIVFLYRGPYSGIGEAYGAIYGHLLKESAVEPLQLPMFEKYLNDPETTPPEELLTEIWIPIK